MSIFQTLLDATKNSFMNNYAPQQAELPPVGQTPSYANPQTGYPGTTNPNDIVVQAPQAPQQPQALPPPNFPPPQPQQQQIPQGSPMPEAKKRGFLNKLLGTLGDAMLMQSGNAPIYAPAVDREHIAAAMQGMGTDPTAAIAKVAQYDPRLAEQLYSAQGLNAYRSAMVPIRKMTATATANTSDAKVDEIYRKRAAAMTAAGMPIEDVIAYGASKNLDWSELQGMDPRSIDAWAVGNGTTVNQQVMAQLGQDSLKERGRHNLATEGIGSRNADSNAVRAGAAASQAGTAARVAPSRIAANEAGAAYARANTEFTDAGLEAGGGRGVKPVRKRPGSTPTIAPNGMPKVAPKGTPLTNRRTGQRFISDGKRWVEQ